MKKERKTERKKEKKKKKTRTEIKYYYKYYYKDRLSDRPVVFDFMDNELTVGAMNQYIARRTHDSKHSLGNTLFRNIYICA